ncbi:MAG: tetratricopeptide repeat protein [Desulfobulbus sp.]|nr:tetratricopeptide repeat protein [Desulfobulbus sp.]
MDAKGMIKKERVYLYVVAALFIGFVGGVVYSAYQTPVTAGVHQEEGRGQGAAETIAALEKAAKDNPKDGQVWVELGHAYFDTGQAKQAIAAYNKALELLPGDLNVMTDLGVMYHQDNQHQKAIEVFDQVLRANPEHEQARFNKGVVLLTGLNDPKAALAEWKILVKYRPMAAAPSGQMVADLIDQVEKQMKETAKP